MGYYWSITLYIGVFYMFSGDSLLSMVEVMIECPICLGRAIFTDEKGDSKCVVCNPYRYREERNL